MNATAEKEKILCAAILFGKLFAGPGMGKQRRKLSGNQSKLMNRVTGLLFVHGAALLCQVECEQVQGGELAGECLGGSDANFGPGVGVDRSGGLARNHRTNDVADGERLRAS